MSRPHPALLEIAAGRPAGASGDPEAVLASAVEHKVIGLLRHSAETGLIELGKGVEAVLARRTLRTAAHNTALWTEIEAVAALFGSAGIEFGVFKGVTTEARYYPRPGTRPASDVDIFVAPHHRGRFGEAVRLLSPGHVLGDVVQRYVGSGIIQSTDIELASGIWIDIHADPFKTGLPARTLSDIWRRVETITSPAGCPSRVLDTDTALVQALLHLQKDRYSYLIGFADIARIIGSRRVDWDAVHTIAAAEGLSIHLDESLRAVRNTLDLDIGLPPARPMAFLWRRLWPESSQLQGDVGMSRMVRTRYWIPFSIRGRRREALRWWLRLIFPPKRLFRYFHPDVTGPYGWRLISLRTGLAWSRHKRNAAQRALGQAFRKGWRGRFNDRRADSRTFLQTGQ